MSSAKQSHLEQAEEEARNAVDKLAANRVERERERAIEDEAVAQQRGGDVTGKAGEKVLILGNVKEGSKSIFHAVTGKAGETAGKDNDSLSDKGAGAHAKENERVIKDTTATDDTPEKIQMKPETREDVDYKEPLAARGHVVDYLTGLKEGTTVAKLGETTESARQKLEDVKKRATEKAVEGRQKVEGDQRREELGYDVDAEKGKAAKGNTYGTAPNFLEVIKKKMVMPTDVVRHKRREEEEEEQQK